MATAVALIMSLIGGGAIAQSLEDAVRIAIGDHPTVKVAEANARAANATVDEKYSGWLPRLDLRAATSSEHVNNPATRARNARSTGDNLAGNVAGNTGGQAGVNIWSNSGTLALTQNLFGGFATMHSVDAARKRAAVTRQLVLDARDVIGLRVV